MEKIPAQGDIVDVVSDSVSVRDVVANKIALHTMEDEDDAFFVFDLGDVVRKYEKWKALLPRVHPFYAVKCNEDAVLLQFFAALGIGFVCASLSEIQEITDLGVDPSRIVYANPCKSNSHLKFAAKKNVRLMTFDNEMELHKVKAVFPDAKLLIRILTDDATSHNPLSIKFGCHPRKTPYLLKVAKELDLDVVGVSFHVGSGCTEARTFAGSIESARMVFDYGEQLGFKFDMLDIGGGYPGQVSAPITFEEIALTINQALNEHFPKNCGVTIIAEPGRYFVASAYTTAIQLIAKRMLVKNIKTHYLSLSEEFVDKSLAADDISEPYFMYHCNDGIYGSFSCILNDEQLELFPCLLKDVESEEPRFNSTLWGPTCNTLDRIKEDCLLPELEVGDYLLFYDRGAYSTSCATTFCGFDKLKTYYMATASSWSYLTELWPSYHDHVGKVDVKINKCTESSDSM
ncbi:ornithine decarboxylase-like [Glandiceps talaboti]